MTTSKLKINCSETAEMLLRGIGQIMFQNNALSGVLFLAGIFYNSFLCGIAAITACIISTYTAILLKYDKNDIQNGLYGFNGALVGIFFTVFFEINVLSTLALIVASMASTLVMFYMKKWIPPFTFPFVFVSWVSYWVLNTLQVPVAASIDIVRLTFIDIVNALLNNLGQVMFQENIITAWLFIVAILVNSKRAFAYALIASLLSVICARLLDVTPENINAGLMGYNAILCAIALMDDKKLITNFVFVTIAVIVSVFIQINMLAVGWISLTAPFVFSTWIVQSILFLRNKSITAL